MLILLSSLVFIRFGRFIFVYLLFVSVCSVIEKITLVSKSAAETLLFELRPESLVCKYVLYKLKCFVIYGAIFGSKHKIINLFLVFILFPTWNINDI